MRFVNYIANKNGPLKSARISIPEMRKSTEKIVQIVQRQYFSEEIDCLTDGRQVKGHSKLSNLSPVLIEGTIRVGGRIRHAPIPFDAIHPMILPRDHPVSTFIVRHYHEYLGHAGREHVLCAKDSGYYKRELWFVKFCESVSAAVSEMKLLCSN